MHFSGASLVKSSASQLLYLEITSKVPEATPGQITGNAHADAVVEEAGGAAEKRGTISFDFGFIHFCYDMVLLSPHPTLVEIKQVRGEAPDWYLESSLRQTAFYAEAAKRIKTLCTPTFRIRQGFAQEYVEVPSEATTELWFGDDRYTVIPSEELYDHYVKKARLIAEAIPEKDFDKCRAWDAQFKHKESDLFQIKFNKK